MSDTNTLLSIPVRGWHPTSARHDDCAIYYHKGRNELAWEDPQTAHLVALPPAAETTIRADLGLKPALEATVEAHSAVLAFGLGPEVD